MTQFPEIGIVSPISKPKLPIENYYSRDQSASATEKELLIRPFPLPVVDDELRPIPARGWAEMIRKVDPMLCPRCGGLMEVIAFLTDCAVVDRIIDHLKLSFIAERPPPSRTAYQEVLMAAEAPAESFS